MLDTDLREENLYLIACDQEPTPTLLESIRKHPACYPALAAWTVYVEQTGQKIQPPDPPLLTELSLQDNEPDALEAEPDTVESHAVKKLVRKPKEAAPLPAKTSKSTLYKIAILVAISVVLIVVLFLTMTTKAIQHPAAPKAAVKNDSAQLENTADLTASGEGFICQAKGSIITCWGQANHGQLGAGAASTEHVGKISLGKPVTALAAGADFACATTGIGVTCWGDNRWRQASDSDAQIMEPTRLRAFAGKKVTSLAAGELHACVVASGKLYCWGSGFSGQLADGKEGAKASAVKEIPVPEGEKLKQVMSSRFGSCVKVVSGKVFCWGANEGQRIAEGDTEILGLTEMKAANG